jgi:hypothetical protein
LRGRKIGPHRIRSGYDRGVTSIETYQEILGLDPITEKERRLKEFKNGDEDTVQPVCARRCGGEPARELENGHDLAGKDLKGSPRFLIGACVTPEADVLEPQVIKMERKVEVGAQFFQTQAVYDARKFAEFMSMVRHIKVPVLAGIVVLRSNRR